MILLDTHVLVLRRWMRGRSKGSCPPDQFNSRATAFSSTSMVRMANSYQSRVIPTHHTGICPKEGLP